MARRDDRRTEGDRGPVVLVTGCSSGLGRALVGAFAEAGCRVVATARRVETVEGLAADRVLVHPLDITDPEQRGAAVEAATEWAHHPDVLVNNAGWGLIGPAAELDLDDVRRQLETNVVATLAMIQTVVPGMAARESGRIVTIGSVSAVTTTPFSGAYCASKAAVHSLCDALRMELGQFGIAVVEVQPGAVESSFADTASHGLDRYRRPESLYRSLVDRIEARARLSQQRPTPATEVARRVVRGALSRRPPAVLRVGHGSRLLPLIGRLPTGLRDRILRRRFGL